MFAADYDQLSAHGREQARTLGVVLAGRLLEADRPGFDAVFSGPARRHRDTAALTSEGFASASLRFPDPIVLAGFDEHDGQALVAAALAQLTEQAEPRVTALATAAMDTTLEPRQRSKSWQRLFEVIMRRWLRCELELEGVETWPAFHQRVRDAFTQLRAAAHGEIAVFTSVGPIAVVLHEVLGLPPERAFEQAWRVYNSSITRVVYSGDRMTLDGFNEVAHLPLGQWTHR